MRSFYLLVQIYSEFTPHLPSETVRSTQKSVKDPSDSPVEGREVKVRVKVKVRKRLAK